MLWLLCATQLGQELRGEDTRANRLVGELTLAKHMYLTCDHTGFYGFLLHMYALTLGLEHYIHQLVRVSR